MKKRPVERQGPSRTIASPRIWWRFMEAAQTLQMLLHMLLQETGNLFKRWREMKEATGLNPVRAGLRGLLGSVGRNAIFSSAGVNRANRSSQYINLSVPLHQRIRNAPAWSDSSRENDGKESSLQITHSMRGGEDSAAAGAGVDVLPAAGVPEIKAQKVGGRVAPGR